MPSMHSSRITRLPAFTRSRDRPRRTRGLLPSQRRDRYFWPGASDPREFAVRRLGVQHRDKAHAGGSPPARSLALFPGVVASGWFIGHLC